jgi:hypothetical protein
MPNPLQEFRTDKEFNKSILLFHPVPFSYIVNASFVETRIPLLPETTRREVILAMVVLTELVM